MCESNGYQITGIQFKKFQLDTCNWTPKWSHADYMTNRCAKNQLKSRILLLKILNEQFKSLWKSLVSGRKIIKKCWYLVLCLYIKKMHGCLKKEVWDSCTKKVSLDHIWLLSLERGKSSKNCTKAIQMFPNTLRKCSKISKDNWRLLKNFKDIPRMFQPHTNRFRCSLRGQTLFQSSYQYLQ